MVLAAMLMLKRCMDPLRGFVESFCYNSCFLLNYKTALYLTAMVVAHECFLKASCQRGLWIYFQPAGSAAQRVGCRPYGE